MTIIESILVIAQVACLVQMTTYNNRLKGIIKTLNGEIERLGIKDLL